jgi:hypothetical protein
MERQDSQDHNLALTGAILQMEGLQTRDLFLFPHLANTVPL